MFLDCMQCININWYCEVSIQGVRYFKQDSTKLTKLLLVSGYCLELQIWALSKQQDVCCCALV
jgi:hypothetical protein